MKRKTKKDVLVEGEFLLNLHRKARLEHTSLLQKKTKAELITLILKLRAELPHEQFQAHIWAMTRGGI